MGKPHPVSIQESAAERAWLLGESRREFDARPHVCGNCRNPWSSTGREDCPNAQEKR